MNIPRFAVKYPVSTSMLFLGVVLLGIISVWNLGTDLLPDIASPKIVIRLEAGEKPPEEMERKYTKNIESFVSTLNNVKKVSSSSLTGLALVTVEFDWDTDMNFALLDVQKVAANYSGDRDVSNVIVERYDPRTAPIMTISILPLEGQDLDDVRNDVEKVIRRRFQRVDGVAAAEISGGREKEIIVRLRPYHLMAYNLQPADIIGKIQSTNINESGGRAEDNEKVYIVKGIGEFQSLDEINNLVVGYTNRSSSGGSRRATREENNQETPQRIPVYMKDLADIEYLDKEIKSKVRYNGTEGVGIAIYKEAEKNTVATSNEVRKELEDLKRDFPDLDFVIAKDQASFISSAIGEVEFAAGMGIILAILILTFFLRNFWATLIVVFSIPISIIATFNLMYFNNLTLNIMTLGGLALGAGMLVDNSIVVMENIYRHLRKGESPRDAAISGTSEVGVAILASTATTVIVFLPILYVHGVGAELFKEQAFTVAFSLVSSLVVAFLLIPAAASKVIKVKNDTQFKQLRSKFYYGLLEKALNNKWKVVVSAFAVAFVCIQLLGSVGTEFIPKSDQRQFTIDIRLPEGTLLETTSSLSKIIEDLMIENSDGFVESIYSEIGEQTTVNYYMEEDKGSNTATITVHMRDKEDGSYLPTTAFIQSIQSAVNELPEIETEFALEQSAVENTLGGLTGGLVLLVKGPELDQLEELSEELVTAIDGVEGVFNLKSSFQEGRPEINIELKRIIAAGLGLNMNSVVSAVKNRLSESVASDMHFLGTDRDIRVAYPKLDIEELNKISITTSTGAKVSLKNVANLNRIYSPKKIEREEQSRVGFIYADIRDDYKYSDIISEVNNRIAAISLPRDYVIEVSGEEREREKAFSELGFALILAVILVYMVLASLFESFIHPFTILLAVPMAGIGSVILFYVLNMPFSIMAFIGIIMLAGIAVNDAIIFVDYIGILRSKGMECKKAVLQAGQDRLRPIIMTSLTTMLALTPLIIGIGEGAKLRAPLAYAVIGGLATSTIMTLIITPCLYLILDNFRPKKYRDKQIRIS
ncbi:MAG: efflux RND transporter permease subunit [bacterium]|nr:efflux RND transporter permease subunit [bacterium]